MDKRRLRYCVAKVTMYAYNAKCDDMHHTAKDEHEADHLCPVEYDLHKCIHDLTEELIKREMI